MLEWANHLVPLHIYRLENFLFFVVVAFYFWNHYQMKKLLQELKAKRAEKAAKEAMVRA